MSAPTATAGTPPRYSSFVKREAYLVPGVGDFTIGAAKTVLSLDLSTSLRVEPEWGRRLDGARDTVLVDGVRTIINNVG